MRQQFPSDKYWSRDAIENRPIPKTVKKAYCLSEWCGARKHYNQRTGTVIPEAKGIDCPRCGHVLKWKVEVL